MHSSGLLKGCKFALAAVAGALFCTASHAQAPETVTSFASAPPAGSCVSSYPKTLGELMQGNKGGETVNIVGHLFLPPGSDKVPAVVLVHGSGGIYNAELDYWPKQFNAAGIAVFTLDMFGPRGVQSTADDQSQVPFTADVADAFAALRLSPPTRASTGSASPSWASRAAAPRRCARPSRGSSPPRSCRTACAMPPPFRPTPAAVREFFGWW